MVARLEALQKVEEVTEETQVEKNLPKMELPIWFDGKQINEILLYQTILQQHEINLDVPVSERSFARRFKERSADYGMTYDKNISVGNGRFCRGFRGVHVKVRTKDVNY